MGEKCEHCGKDISVSVIGYRRHGHGDAGRTACWEWRWADLASDSELMESRRKYRK